MRGRLDSGERTIPDQDIPHNLGFLRLMVAYKFAKSFIRDKYVLEVGCGAGYGAYYLAPHGARSVVGIDISKEVIEYSMNNYNQKDLEFQVMDGTKLAFKKDAFGVICCFQVIEHIKQYKALLSEICRVLKPNGIFIISTPNRSVRGESENPFHTQEFSLNELRKLLNTYFREVKVLGVNPNIHYMRAVSSTNQRILSWLGQLLARINLRIFSLRTTPRWIKSFVYRDIAHLSTNDLPVSTEELDRSMDFIVVCKDTEV